MGKIFEKILPSKNIDRWQIITWKKARHHYSSERHKLKQDMTIYHLNSKMFFKKNQQYQMLVKMQSNWNIHTLHVGMKNGTFILETVGQFSVQLKIYYCITVITFLGIYPRKMKTVVTSKLVCKSL